MQIDKKLRFPLGGDLYAYVNTRRRDGVKIHIRHFQLSTHTKGGVKPTYRGVKMDAKTLRRLFAIKKQLTEEFKHQTSKVMNQKAASSSTSSRQDKKKKKKKKHQAPSTEEPTEGLRQQRTWPVYSPEPSQTQNVNNYPAAFFDVGAVTPTYSYSST